MLACYRTILTYGVALACQRASVPICQCASWQMRAEVFFSEHFTRHVIHVLQKFWEFWRSDILIR